MPPDVPQSSIGAYSSGLKGISGVLSSFWSDMFDTEVQQAPDGSQILVPISTPQLGETWVPATKGDSDGSSSTPRYEFGTPPSTIFAPVDDQEDAQVGDTLRITYDMSFPWLQEWQAKALRAAWTGRDDFQLQYTAIQPEYSRVVLVGQVLKPFSPVVVVAVALAAAIVGIAIYLSVRSIERAISAILPKIPPGAINIVSVAILGFVAWLVIREFDTG